MVEEEGEIQPKEETTTLEDDVVVHAVTTIQAAFRGMKVCHCLIAIIVFVLKPLKDIYYLDIFGNPTKLLTFSESETATVLVFAAQQAAS